MIRKLSFIALIAVMMTSAPVFAKDKFSPKKPGSDTIATLASGDPELTTLVSLLDTAGLVGVLNGSGQYTVFAPTNEAFEPVLALLDSLGLELTVEQLTNILLYHVTSGRRSSNSVVNDNDYKALDMLNGGVVMSVPGGILIDTNAINDDILDPAIIFDANIKASNGFIHKIDQVLIPSNLLD
jgi:uncharacterized surface protein with fasciclin (FAS1) repeats